MDNINTYSGWGDYAVSYDKHTGIFSLTCPGSTEAVHASVDEIHCGGTDRGGVEIFNSCTVRSGRAKRADAAYLTVDYKDSPVMNKLTLKFTISDSGVSLNIKASCECAVVISGMLSFGDRGSVNTYPMYSGKSRGVIRSAVGPASSCKDDMLYDRLTDSALRISGGSKLRIKYDDSLKSYVFKAVTGEAASHKTIKIQTVKDILANQYNIEFVPLSKKRTFTRPPVGWMTWYAVKFDACEEKVLKNAAWMSENLIDYGADCVWIDWEWYHKDLSGSRHDGADTFNPDKSRYPHGLRYMSEKIRALGLEPALWIGFTNDGDMNEYIRDNPEIILADEPAWCGRYFLDITHPEYLDGFLPKALANVHKWGYKAVKYDTLPICMMMHEKYHHRLFDPTLTTRQAYRNMISKTREILGDECYMLSCAAYNDADVLWGAGVFDSARIGDDIFKWEEFVVQGVEKAMRFYPLHNTVMYPDCDNVVMREEYNDIYQAASRIYFVSMLGLPITFGDEFDALDDKRIEFIKSCLPVLDIHPMDAYRGAMPKDVLKMNLAVNKPWESYNVVNVFNLLSEGTQASVDLKEDIGLESGKYLIYDYTYDKFLGIYEQTLSVEMKACESRILSIRQYTGRPQLLSTSRHISQGAAEIDDMIYSAQDCELVIHAKLIKEAPYTLTLYVPEGYMPEEDLLQTDEFVYKKLIVPQQTGMHEIKIKFVQEGCMK